MTLAEIRLRAKRRIGELSRELEGTGPKGGRPRNVPGSGNVSKKAALEAAGRGTVRLPVDGKPKKAVLKAAGLSTSEANRCEKLAAVGLLPTAGKQSKKATG